LPRVAEAKYAFDRCKEIRERRTQMKHLKEDLE